MSSCPGEDILRLLGTDALDEATYAAIEQHVEGCPECPAILERLALACRRPDSPLVLPSSERWPRIPGFEIQRELGRGAMGVVYLAIRTGGLDRPVALKILPAAVGAAESPAARRRWLREARAISSIRHPNVVPLYDYGEADGWFYLVLEYVPGGTLKKRLAEPLPPQVAAGLVETIARAVGYVHVQGVHHLDMKPSNILLDCEENAPWDRVNPRVADFGLALSGSDAGPSESSLAAIRGTPSYMAPEQATATRAGGGAAADIYALGAILYELLTGRPPFQGASTLETLDQVRGQEPVPPRRLIPKIPRDLETIALKCLEKSPSRRYTSAIALAEDLRRWLDGRPVMARPVWPIEHVWRWCCRQPVMAVLAATLLLTMTGSFLGLVALLRRSEAQRSRSEANYQVASQALDELLGLILEDAKVRLIYNHSSYVATIKLARAQAIELTKRYPLDIASLRRLGWIDAHLASTEALGGRQEEARSLLEESIDYLETCLALGSNDLTIHRQLLEDARCMLESVIGSENDHLYGPWNARAIAMLERLGAPAEVRLYEMLRLNRSQRHHADYLMRRGESDLARQELEKVLRLVRSVPVGETAYPEFILSEALTLAALGQWTGEFTPLRSPIHPRPANVAIGDLEQCLADLAARRIGWLPSIVKSPWLLPEDLPTEAWTDRVISSIQSDATRFDIDHTRIPVIGWMMRHHCLGTLAWQRRVGKLGDAHRIADQLLTLAERMTRSYPAQAAGYMLLSDGYVQKAKNAYREDDASVIEQWERKAVEAAMRAAALEPENAEAHSLVQERRSRLNKLTSK
jgi:eukaryotic-like serine/threonine-protein kinase